MKYPIGIQSFEDIRQRGFVYVDKTALIYKLVNEGCSYQFVRPRRFGKSLLIDTLECYFQGRKELFQGLAIEKLEKEWEQYPVFHIDFNGSNYRNEEELEKRIEKQLIQWEELYGSKDYETSFGDRFMGVLSRAYQKTGHKAVVLIDEYDKPLLDVFDTGLKHSKRELLLEEEYRNVLRGFYSVLKSADKYLRFVFLTGVTKFAQISIFSGLNNLEDISMSRELDTLCGISLEEVQTNFKEPIQEFANDMHISYDEMLHRLRDQYDGYHFSKALVDVFNPFSLLSAFKSMDLRNYWFATGSPEYLIRLMEHSSVDIEDLINHDYVDSDFMDYKASSDNPLPILFQSGYLTIKSYDSYWETYRLDFPNKEVRSGLLPLLTGSYLAMSEIAVRSEAQRLSATLIQGDIEAFKLHLTSFLASIPYDSHEPLKHANNTEKFFQMVFYLIMRLIGSYRLTTKVEQTQALGRLDCVVETPQYIYIFEFKLNATAHEAMLQIEASRYAEPYLTDGRKIVCMGVNFSSETKNINDWEVKM